MRAKEARIRKGDCVDVHIVSSPVSASQRARAPRGSMGTPHKPLLLDGQGHAVSRVAERALRIAVTPGHGERPVVAAHRHHLRGARRQRAVGVGDALERLILDREPIDSVHRRVGRLRDHRGDRYALGPDHVARDQRVVGNEACRAPVASAGPGRPSRDRRRRRPRRHPPSFRGGGVERANPRVRVRAPRQDQVQRRRRLSDRRRTVRDR